MVRPGIIPRRDDGGSLTGGTDPSTAQLTGSTAVAPNSVNQSPVMQGVTQQLSKMTPEQLQEYAVRMGNSPQGQVAQRVLQQKRIMSASQPQTAPQAPTAPTATGLAPQPSPTGMLPSVQQQAKGGIIKRALGGAAVGPDYGLLNSPMGAAGGRSDTLPHAVKPDTYVIPADVVSGLGEGDTYSGAKTLDAVLHQMAGGSGDAPRPYQSRASGGAVDKHVPVLVANGEYLVHPDQVAALGNGDHKKGHEVLDAFVKHVRAKTIKQMSKLPGPVK